MFENPRRGRQARNFTTNVPKILDLQIVFRRDIFRKLTLGAPDHSDTYHIVNFNFTFKGFFLREKNYKTMHDDNKG